MTALQGSPSQRRLRDVQAVTSTAHSARKHGNPAPPRMKRTNGAVRRHLLKAAAGTRASSSWGDSLSYLQW